MNKSRGERGHEEQETGRGRQRRRRRDREAHGTRTGTSGEDMHLDWNVGGRSGPGLERPGLHKEEEAAAAINGKENVNKSKERWRGRTRKTRAGKREEKKQKKKQTNAWNSDENTRGGKAPGLQHPRGRGHGLEHPGKRRPWTGASGVAKGGGCDGSKKRQGEQAQEQGRWRERTRRKRVGRREEREKKEKRASA